MTGGLPPGTAHRAGVALDTLVRVQQDFPIPGVLFRDLTAVLANAPALADVADALAWAEADVDLIAGIEARGFLLGAAAAVRRGLGVVAVRKPGKLPGAVLAEDYALEYGRGRLEMHPDDVPAGARVLIIDDVLATGGTAAAACRLIRRAGGIVAGISVAVELPALGGRAATGEVPLHALRAW
ncbi:adenine phosphoribosyltransferase [Nakamurella flavida]|uniref:Adenine phosphoribosyltransferase n=1 Tax=Nakamurella flavida TaxID=363630 RepID=A0A938YR46_9ACTN|nr:adenine phosphoribosyltransferase [Nakamurella flavida]MBM9477400.1 adenine phosphoribosyltransferase [Nakamurella flavida]MDP9777333.1 adenine phosphoribosyltransferase [Nakamurella flavida]